MKILLVADSPWVINQTHAALGGSHDIVAVGDPRHAETTLAEHSADVIIIDMQVGSMGGMALTRSLKGIVMAGEAPDAPMVLLLDRSADEFLAKRSGADTWLLKPFTAQDLAAKLASVGVVADRP